MSSQEEIDLWDSRVAIAKRANWWFFIFEGLALSVASLVLLFALTNHANHSKDRIYILIVGFMFLYGVFETPLNAVFLLNEVQPKKWLQVFLFFAFYTNFMVHWLFPM